MKHKNKIVIIAVVLLFIVIAGIAFVCTTNREQSEACRKWEEIKSQNEQQTKESNSEIQDGVSIMQAQEMKYRNMCRE